MKIEIEPKYEFIAGDEFYCPLKNCTYRRIRASRNFGSVKKGQIGGYIGHGSSLSHAGNCWLADEAMISDQVIIQDNAWVGGYADISHSCTIKDDAVVSGYATLYGPSLTICGRAIISGNCSINKDSWIGGTTHIEGFAEVVSARDLVEGYYDRHWISGTLEPSVNEINEMSRQFILCRALERGRVNPPQPLRYTLEPF